MAQTSSIKHCILAYLGGFHGYVFGGVLDDAIHKETGAKSSNVSRRCRELVEEQKIDVEYVQINGAGPRVVRYRLHQDTPQSLAL